MAYSFPYDTETHELQFGIITVDISCITNFDDLLNALISKGEDHEDYKDERLPYWADLWHSALALSQYLTENDIIKPCLNVTEIGCGLGVPGIVAAKLGGNVTLTDYMQETLDFLAINWKQNFDVPLQASLLDWRNPDPHFQADLLLASDVAYEKRAFDVLPKAIKILSKPGGRIILTEPQRKIAKPFLKTLETDINYSISKSVIEVKWNDFYKKINILDLKRILN